MKTTIQALLECLSHKTNGIAIISVDSEHANSLCILSDKAIYFLSRKKQAIHTLPIEPQMRSENV